MTMQKCLCPNFQTDEPQREVSTKTQGVLWLRISHFLIVWYCQKCFPSNLLLYTHTCWPQLRNILDPHRVHSARHGTLSIHLRWRNAWWFKLDPWMCPMVEKQFEGQCLLTFPVPTFCCQSALSRAKVMKSIDHSWARRRASNKEMPREFQT